jgi:hypothetical protein
MKKVKTKILSVVLIISLLLSVLAIQVSANQSSALFNSVAHHFFDGLGGEIPLNKHGSCVLVAMSLIFAFYDIYWNDAFVAVNYESDDLGYFYATSAYPESELGIKVADLTAEQVNNKAAYTTFALENENEYLLMKLISLCFDIGIFDGTESTFGITTSEIPTILDAYFDEIFGNADYYKEDGNYDSTLPVTIHKIRESSEIDRQSVIDAIEAQVALGNPVIYTGGDDDGRHAMVAYAEKNYDILLHTGKGVAPLDTVSQTGYQYDIAAVWIEINEDVLPHECSGNYSYNNGTAVACSCQAYRTLHPEHRHEVAANSWEYNSDKHTYRCVWGCNVEDWHAFRCTSVSASYHSAVCNCGYTTVLPHLFVTAENPRYSRCAHCNYTKDNWGPGGNVQMDYNDNPYTE